MGIKPSHSNQLMAEVIGLPLLKDCLEGIINVARRPISFSS